MNTRPGDTSSDLDYLSQQEVASRPAWRAHTQDMWLQKSPIDVQSSQRRTESSDRRELYKSNNVGQSKTSMRTARSAQKQAASESPPPFDKVLGYELHGTNGESSVGTHAAHTEARFTPLSPGLEDTNQFDGQVRWTDDQLGASQFGTQQGRMTSDRSPKKDSMRARTTQPDGLKLEVSKNNLGTTIPSKKPRASQTHRSNRARDSQELLRQARKAEQAERRRQKADKERKLLLAKALKRANHAVNLDNEQDYAEALVAYEQACKVLGRAMDKDGSVEEHAKLIEIWDSYTTRIDELWQHINVKSPGEDFGQSSDKFVGETLSSSLPARPRDYRSQNDPNDGADVRNGSTLTNNALRDEGNPTPGLAQPLILQRSSGYANEASATSNEGQNANPDNQAPHSNNGGQQTDLYSGDPVGTLVTAPSRHSVRSLEKVLRRYSSNSNLDTEAAFAAALDAAVEAAYDEGLEFYRDDAEANAHELEVQRREEEITAAQRNWEERVYLAHSSGLPNSTGEELSSDMDSDEEERLLDHVSREFSQANNTESEAKSSMPRQSDSSGLSNRTFGSSAASSSINAGISLFTVDENTQPPLLPPQALLKSMLPVSSTTKVHMTQPPDEETRMQATGVRVISSSLNQTERHRRLSGGTKKLKIETDVGLQQSAAAASFEASNVHHLRTQPSSPPLPTNAPTALPSSGHALSQQPFKAPEQALSVSSADRIGPPPVPSPFKSNSSIVQRQDSNSPLTDMKNFSNSELSPYLVNELFVDLSRPPPGTLSPGTSDPSPGTPMSFGFGTPLSPLPHLVSQEVESGHSRELPIGQRVKFFENEIHDSDAITISTSPRLLEPCPRALLLRPFWLLRCIYQTLTHPTGGYISSRLFIPHEVWKVKNNKLKGIEEKIVGCDLLTAALLKLSSVDTFDADATLEEMQSLEGVLDQVQGSLSKKLGNEVGIHSVSLLFKDASTSTSQTTSYGDSNQTIGMAESIPLSTASSVGSTKSSGKSWQSSWKKLRSKGSAVGSTTSNSVVKDGSGEMVTLASLPMTSSSNATPSSRGRVKREHSGPLKMHKIEGPNGNYASALVRLCDAAQVLDQITRQVEDPGLKLSSPTHVGLELSARHAAEFFGFFVCRFVLQDLTLLTEKFVKRASEWVLT